MSVIDTLCTEFKLTEGQAELLVERLGETNVKQYILENELTPIYREMIIVKRLTSALSKQGLSPDSSGVQTFNETLAEGVPHESFTAPAIDALLKQKL